MPQEHVCGGVCVRGPEPPRVPRAQGRGREQQVGGSVEEYASGALSSRVFLELKDAVASNRWACICHPVQGGEGGGDGGTPYVYLVNDSRWGRYVQYGDLRFIRLQIVKNNQYWCVGFIGVFLPDRPAY